MNYWKLFIAIWITLHATHIIAQSEDYGKSDENLKTVTELRLGDGVSMGFDSRYQGVKGTPLIFDEFRPAQVFVKGKGVVVNLQVNFNNYDNTMQYINPENNETMMLNNGKVDSIFFNDNGKIITFKKFDHNLFDININPFTFFEVMKTTDSYTLLAYDHVLFRKADFEGAYSSDVRYDEFVKEPYFFIRLEGDNFEKIKPSKRALKNIFPDKKKQIKAVLKKYSSLDNEKEILVKIVDELTEK